MQNGRERGRDRVEDRRMRLEEVPKHHEALRHAPSNVHVFELIRVELSNIEGQQSADEDCGDDAERCERDGEPCAVGLPIKSRERHLDWPHDIHYTPPTGLNRPPSSRYTTSEA